MGEVLACRICLETDVKLYDMLAYKLSEAYQKLLNLQVPPSSDGLPHHLCSSCAVLLLKAAKLQQKAYMAHQLLMTAAQQRLLTTSYIKTLDRESFNLSLPYETEDLVSFKEEIKKSCLGSKRVKVEVESDDEPLTSIAPEKKKKKYKSGQRKDKKVTKTKNVKVKTEANNMSELMDSLDLPLEDVVNQALYEEPQSPEDVSNDEGVDEKPVIEELNVTDAQDLQAEFDVVELSEGQQRAEIENRKNSQNYLNSTFRCEKCYKGFLVDTAYNNHMEKHDPNFGPYACEICHIRFKHKHTLHSHRLNAHSRNYICKRCGHIAKAKVKAKEHFQWHLGVAFPCDVCGANFFKRTTLLTHIRMHHATASVCDICHVCFVSPHGLKVHTRKAHSTSNGQSGYKCDQCATQFVSDEALNKHASLAVDNICDTSVRPCSLCGEGFPSKEELKQHVKEHQKTEQIECLECHKSYSSRRYYAAHCRRAHSTGIVKPVSKAPALAVCELCGKKCKSKVTLVYHQRTHSGEKPYQCTECPKRFSVLQRLQYHLRVHSGERPCQCPHCPKAFRHKAALNRHVRVHTGAKPYVCPHCRKGFSQSNTLKGHIRTVHLKLPALYRKPASTNNSMHCD